MMRNHDLRRRAARILAKLGELGWLLGFFLGLAHPATAADADRAPAEIRQVKDLAYYDGPGADPVKHKLDLYLPRDRKDFPVVFFVHGGAWRHGDRNFLGVYSTFGSFLARNGIGAAVTSYRLSPGVQHPEHIKDVARAFAWTHKHIADYGGRPDQLFVSGHSAGGHLVALLATDDRYLKGESLELRAIKGVIPMSGVYRIPDENRLFTAPFGNDAEKRRQASPLIHAQQGAPPFLIIYAENDFSFCGKEPSEAFCKALKDKQVAAQTLEVKKRNHINLLLRASLEDDPAGTALLRFIAERVKS
jgi:acetyl esterase/lipase